MFDWLFGSGRQTNYDDTAKFAQQANKANADAVGFYEDNFANGGWENMDANRRADALAQYNVLKGTADAGSQQYGDVLNLFNKEEKDNRYNYFGNGLLGAILNPIGQTVSAGKDLATGQYAANGRDVASDLGALGSTALTFIPGVGGFAKGAGVMSKAGKAINSVPGMAAVGAGFGAADAYRQGGSETDLGDALGAAGTGAMFGAGIPIVGKVGGKMLRKRGSKVLTNEMSRGGMDDEMISKTMSAVPNRALYQTALRSYIPRSTMGKVVAGGGALYGANALMSGGQSQAPSDYEQQLLMAGGY